MPNLYIIGGCNGAGKTTISYTLLPEVLHCREFVNADIIASGLSPLNPGGVAVDAGQLMLDRIGRLMHERKDVAFESTLDSRGYIPLIREAKKAGYEILLIYLWLDSPELSMERVEDRARKGGAPVSKELAERSYYWSIHNLINLYVPLADHWVVIDNRNLLPRIIESGGNEDETTPGGFGTMEMTRRQHPPSSNRKKKTDTLSEKILSGIKKALRQLAESRAAANEELIVTDQDGTLKSVPAKKLLPLLYKEDQVNR